MASYVSSYADFIAYSADSAESEKVDKGVKQPIFSANPTLDSIFFNPIPNPMILFLLKR